MQIIDLSSKRLNQVILTKCAELYCAIWKEEPWNEDFWTVPGVLEDMRIEFTKTKAEAFIALNDDEEVIGFTWGYSVSKEDLQEISGGNLLNNLFANGESLFYIDELGVSSVFRVKGIAKEISQILIRNVQRRNIDSIVLRTDVKAVAARILYEKLGFKELAVQDQKHPDRTYWFLDISAEFSRCCRECC